MLQLVLMLVLFLMENLNGLGVAAVMTVLDPDGFPLLLPSPGAEDYHHAHSGSEDTRTHGRGSGGLQRVDLVPIVRFRGVDSR